VNTDFVLFAGSANRPLAERIARVLGTTLGNATSERFPDGEVSVELLDSVRHKDVFLVQPTSPPVNDHLMELLAFVDACRRASAASVTAVIPYFGYARSDKRDGRRAPIMASLTAELLQSAGVQHVIVLDPHTPQVEGFFGIPVDTVSAVCVLSDALRSLLPPGIVVVSPDAGRVPMASEFARRLDASVAVLGKRRMSGTETEVTHLVGDVQGRPCLVIDDMISTGGTLAHSLEALRAGGASEFWIAATHGLLLGEARTRLDLPTVNQIVLTDSVAVPHDDWPKLRLVSVAELLAEAIGRVHRREREDAY
jgi:ribose-phosphate pyrophosphokinase